MKVKTENIRNIPLGGTTTFKCDTPKGVNNAKATVSYCNVTYASEDGKKYEVETNRAKLEIKVTAIQIEQLKKSKK